MADALESPFVKLVDGTERHEGSTVADLSKVRQVGGALQPGSGGSADMLGHSDIREEPLPGTPAPDEALRTGATQFLLGLAAEK